jgi:hypothetical protein
MTLSRRCAGIAYRDKQLVFHGHFWFGWQRELASSGQHKMCSPTEFNQPKRTKLNIIYIDHRQRNKNYDGKK